MHEGMPNKLVILETTSFKLWITLWAVSSIIMTYHICLCIVLYSWWLICALLFTCVSVELGDGVPEQHYVDPYYQQYPQGKRISTSLCISLDLYFPQIFCHLNIAFDSNVFWERLEYPTTFINSWNHYLFPTYYP